MDVRNIFSGLALAMLVTGSSAAAQDAAETAIILSGTGSGQAKASRDLGSAISGSIGRAANTVRATSRASNAPRPAAPRRRGAQTGPTEALPAGVDALEGTDAPGYRLGNSTTIRVSGDFTPSATTRCSLNCGDEPED